MNSIYSTFHFSPAHFGPSSLNLFHCFPKVLFEGRKWFCWLWGLIGPFQRFQVLRLNPQQCSSAGCVFWVTVLLNALSLSVLSCDIRHFYKFCWVKAIIFYHHIALSGMRRVPPYFHYTRPFLVSNMLLNKLQTGFDLDLSFSSVFIHGNVP